MYPERYQAPALAAHVIGLLERRRAGFTGWDAQGEAKLREEAAEALRDAGRQFAEVADDAAYWARVTEAVLEVAVPRYLKLAQEQTELERRRFGLWRGGDLLSRVAYAGLGLAAAIVVWRTGIPKVVEPLPLGFFIAGPLLPDVWTWRARRRYQKALQVVVDEMAHEQAQQERYRPLSEVGGAPIDEGAAPMQSSGEASRVPEKP
ncbi:MAG: hypothetical protein K1X89_22155 [Myxococcaceae bacterium]|nr:hypothetical protein [Myxococcaceae bacterium]